MPDLPNPQDVSASEPVTVVDQETPPTPQGRVGDPEGLTMDRSDELGASESD